MTESPEAFKSEWAGKVKYANFVRVNSTPEELILDCGLNPQPFVKAPQTVNVSHSFVLMHVTAKGLAEDLKSAIEKYEKDHGFIETDVRKRVLPALR